MSIEFGRGWAEPQHTRGCPSHWYSVCECGASEDFEAAIREVRRAWGFFPLKKTLEQLGHNFPRIALVGCTAEKLTTKAPAGLLYTSRLFKASMEYAARCCDGVLILSAMHGVLELHEAVEPYNVFLGDLTGHDYMAWCVRVSQRLRGMFEPWRRNGLQRLWQPEMVVLAGERYVWKLERPEGWTWTEPLTYQRKGKRVGMGLGERYAFLCQQTAEMLPARDPDMPPGAFRCACGAWGEQHENPRGGRPVCSTCQSRINDKLRAEERAKETTT